MSVLDLKPEWIITPGDRTIARQVESERARRGHAREYHKRFLNDPLIRDRAA
ncbi:hypothetical protein [Sphingomonas sp. AX6]|uniref:hypothetical protein n=1 Tax=Sphingomonas sp. AX6 TaxID=2653171 RepID=UPI00135A5D52|nr:hypothetical protein [Sphingomonas sp. AX6]